MSTEQNSGAGEAAASEAKPSGPMSIQIPVDLIVWSEARKLVADKNVRVEDLATCASQDPVMVIELLRVSNAMYFSGGKSPITSVRTSIVRLGSDVVLETLEKMRERAGLENADVIHWLEVQRSRCKRTSIIARMLAETLARTLTEECQVAGLLLNVGDMVAVAHLKDTYVKLAEEYSRSSVLFRLVQDCKFDVEKMGVNYLRRNGIPEAILFAIEREGRARTPDKTIMKPVCQAAAEIVDAFDTNRWEKIAPGRSLPPKSTLRMLQLADTQYLKIYERASEYLFAMRAQEDRERQAAISAALGITPVEEAPPVPASAESLQSEIDNLLGPSATPAAAAVSPAPAGPVRQPFGSKSTTVQSIDADLGKPGDSFGLSPKAASPAKTVARVQTSKPVVNPPPLRTAKGNEVLGSISTAMDQAKSSEELLAQILDMLIKDGLFEKSALIVVSRDRTKAIVVAARGPSIGNGQKIDITDPLSPLAQCFSKVQSFGSRSNQASPFGSKAFALSPLDADHETPVALYADCGNEGSITFEARRIFRNVVDILNQKLPQVPGGIPVELAD